MTGTQTAGSPALYFGPFNTTRSLGIDRGNYIAIHSSNPEAAAQYAVENMGFYLVHADREGRHYLAAHGLDPYSLVYTPGEQGKVDHISYVVRNADDLLTAEEILTDLGVKSERHRALAVVAARSGAPVRQPERPHHRAHGGGGGRCAHGGAGRRAADDAGADLASTMRWCARWMSAPASSSLPG